MHKSVHVIKLYRSKHTHAHTHTGAGQAGEIGTGLVSCIRDGMVYYSFSKCYCWEKLGNRYIESL